jgi:hypothetical protein
MVRGLFLGNAYHASSRMYRVSMGHKKHIQTAVRLCHVRVFALWDDTLVARQVPNKVKVVQADR